MKTFLTTLLILASLVLTACPKGPKTVRDFREKSAELSTYGEKIITAFGDAYQAGEISREQLAAINPVSGAFVKAVGAYRVLVTEAERYVAAGQPIPTDLASKIDRGLLSVETAFFAVTDIVRPLSAALSERVRAMFSAVRLAIAALKTLLADARIELGLPEVKHGLA
jgi:hypothetical protein